VPQQAEASLSVTHEKEECGDFHTWKMHSRIQTLRCNGINTAGQPQVKASKGSTFGDPEMRESKIGRERYRWRMIEVATETRTGWSQVVHAPLKAIRHKSNHTSPGQMVHSCHFCSLSQLLVYP